MLIAVILFACAVGVCVCGLRRGGKPSLAPPVTTLEFSLPPNKTIVLDEVFFCVLADRVNGRLSLFDESAKARTHTAPLGTQGLGYESEECIYGNIFITRDDFFIKVRIPSGAPPGIATALVHVFSLDDIFLI
jgi:hypothetical protein